MQPVETLLAIEACKQLKARYFETLDNKDWEALAELFADDAVIDYTAHAKNLVDQHGQTITDPSPENWVFTGGKATAAFLAPLLAEVISVHHGHDPQITVTGADSATGVWSLYDRLETKESVYHGYGGYRETYRCVNGRWVYARLLLTRRRSAIVLK
jgi:ketosteroid isomerase-like protein